MSNTRIWAIIRKYARPKPFTGEVFIPMRCTASKAEIESGHMPSDGKIIYDGLENAKRAAQELFQATGVRMEVYTCHRSKRRHHKHLTTDDTWMLKHGRDKTTHPS